MAKDEGETIYEEEGREEMSDDDEIDPKEQGFMKGYDEADEPEEKIEESDEEKQEEE